MIVKGFVIFERTLLSRKESHNFAWSCAIRYVFYCVSVPENEDLISLFGYKPLHEFLALNIASNRMSMIILQSSLKISWTKPQIQIGMQSFEYSYLDSADI